MNTRTKQAVESFNKITGVKPLSGRANTGSTKHLISLVLPLNYDLIFSNRYYNSDFKINGVFIEYMRAVREMDRKTKTVIENPEKVEVDVNWSDLGL